MLYKMNHQSKVEKMEIIIFYRIMWYILKIVYTYPSHQQRRIFSSRSKNNLPQPPVPRQGKARRCRS